MKKLLFAVLILLNFNSFSDEIKYKLQSQRKKVRVESVLGHMRVVVGQSIVMPANETVAAKVITMFKKGYHYCDIKMAQFHHSSSDGFYMLYGIENCEKEN